MENRSENVETRKMQILYTLIDSQKEYCHEDMYTIISQ